MPYYLDNAFLLDNPWITVVGCGGTGGFVAEGLCRLFQGRQATIVLVDHDRVEPHNLLRQNLLRRGRGPLQEPGPRGPAGKSVPASRGLLGLPLPGGGLSLRWGPLPRPSLLRELPAHRLRRQRRRTQGDGRVPAGRPAPVAHRRGQRHQLGPSAHRQRRRPGLWGRTSLRRGDLSVVPSEAVARHWLGRASSLIVAGMMAPLDDDEDVETVRARKSPSCIGTLSLCASPHRNPLRPRSGLLKSGGEPQPRLR